MALSMDLRVFAEARRHCRREAHESTLHSVEEGHVYLHIVYVYPP